MKKKLRPYIWTKEDEDEESEGDKNQNVLNLVYFGIVFRTGPDREVGPWKPGIEMKIGFLSLTNRIFS